MRMTTMTALVAMTCLSAAETARADEAPGSFGRAGAVSIGTDLNLAPLNTLMTANVSGATGLLTPATSLSLEGTSTSNNGGTSFGFSVAPTADYFVIDNLSLGLELLFGYATSTPGTPPGTSVTPQSTNITSYGVAPRVGYNIPLGDTFSLWPKVFFEHAGYSYGGAGAGYGNVQLLGAYVPILFHPVQHFYVGLGPNIVTELGASTNGQGSNSKVTVYGAFASVGGWFNLGS